MDGIGVASGMGDSRSHELCFPPSLSRKQKNTKKNAQIHRPLIYCLKKKKKKNGAKKNSLCSLTVLKNLKGNVNCQDREVMSELVLVLSEERCKELVDKHNRKYRCRRKTKDEILCRP